MSETKQPTEPVHQQLATPSDTATFYAQALPEARRAFRESLKTGRAGDAVVFLDLVQRMEKALAVDLSSVIAQAVDAKLRERQASGPLASDGPVTSREVRVGETGTACFVPPATREAADEMPPQLREAVEQWLRANQLRPEDVRHGRFPLGMVQRWMERAVDAEARLAHGGPAAGEGAGEQPHP